MITRYPSRPLIKVAAIVSLLGISFWIASFFPELVLALILSGLLAFILKPFVKGLEMRVGLSRILSIIVVFLFCGGLLVLAAMTIIPFLLGRVQGLYARFRDFPFEARLMELSESITARVPFLSAEDLTAKVHGLLDRGIQQIGASLENLLSYIIIVGVVPVVTFFILAEGDTAVKKLIERVPNRYFEMTLNVIDKIRQDLVGYLRGWILDATLVGVLSIAAYSIIGVDYPVVIGAISGIANLVPYLGPVAGAVPALLVSITQFGDLRMLLPIAAVVLVVQAIDEVLLQPLCFARTIDMHPLTVIVVLIIGNQLMGLAGMLLAIPIATILKVTARETYWGLKNYRITW